MDFASCNYLPNSEIMTKLNSFYFMCVIFEVYIELYRTHLKPQHVEPWSTLEQLNHALRNTSNQEQEYKSTIRSEPKCLAIGYKKFASSDESRFLLQQMNGGLRNWRKMRALIQRFGLVLIIWYGQIYLGLLWKRC